MIEEKYKFEIDCKKSPLFSISQKNVRDSYQKLSQDKVFPWYNLCLGKSLETTNFYGKKINYDGIEFKGSPKIIFWENYIEPFLEDLIINNIRKTTILCQKHEIQNKLPLNEIKKLLKIAVKNIYQDMNSICPTNSEELEQKKKRLNSFIDEASNNEIKLYSPMSKLNRFYRNNPFWFNLVPIIIAVSAIYLPLKLNADKNKNEIVNLKNKVYLDNFQEKAKLLLSVRNIIVGNRQSNNIILDKSHFLNQNQLLKKINELYDINSFFKFIRNNASNEKERLFGRLLNNLSKAQVDYDIFLEKLPLNSKEIDKRNYILLLDDFIKKRNNLEETTSAFYGAISISTLKFLEKN